MLVTTLSVLGRCVTPEGIRFLVANVGDSRIYRYRNGELTQTSVDHSLVAELLAAGAIDRQQAATHPDRHTVTRAIGLHDDVEVDVWYHEAMPDDRYLICSDGLTNELTDQDLAAALGSHQDAPHLAQALVDRCLAGAARDNVSVVVVDVAGRRDRSSLDAGPSTGSEDTQPRSQRSAP